MFCILVPTRLSQCSIDCIYTTPFCRSARTRESRTRSTRDLVFFNRQLSRQSSSEYSILSAIFDSDLTEAALGRAIFTTTLVHRLPQSRTQIDVLIDTGAEISFIDNALAECLHLPVIEEKQIRLHTFGSKEIQSKKCRLVEMNIWDSEGKQHVLKLLTHDVLTQAFKSPKVSNTDIDFLRSLNLSILTHPENALIKPSILLGCDQLWNFMRTDTPPIRLPSGLHLMPTRLGYIISGKQSKEDHEVQQGLQCHPSEISQWNNLWSMTDEDYPQTTTMSSITVNITQEEKDLWDKYWSMDAAGTEEFVGSEREVRATMDQKIWQQFNDTIERREDGYYVRLPWKEHHPPLPDNKALAFKRLVNVWSSLRKDEHLLDKYNEVFQDQLNKNIVEEVDKEEGRQGETIHFIPHQAVLTPQKTTTKLRIVFDASAHYKGCPSLNDVLHRGPVILPSLHGVLLRVRTGRFAVASDVEKAFLQVRLNEADRDATRCLWLRNHKLPPTADNVRTLRFTRVTFGLKCSPFLLAGTTYFHLDQYTDEKELVEEVKRNLYVDNLLLTANTRQETSHFYQRTKCMFQDLNMNLREFTSNDQDLMQFIPAHDRSVNLNPRLLGITWNSSTDQFLLSCKIPKTSPVTKRTVTSAIASVYDPMGWFLPLLFRARVYLQNLWREQCDWDSKLDENQCKEWDEIRDQCDGFEKSLPRFVSPKGDQAILATFADASTNASFSTLPQARYPQRPRTEDKPTLSPPFLRKAAEDRQSCCEVCIPTGDSAAISRGFAGHGMACELNPEILLFDAFANSHQP
ncbi:hypothetical protein Y032_0015g2655 [Ancylostoma ceylanicum]|nr:hypothetical protein Y032_0015g2655 [Ancylostoma ceylanicum]